MTNRQTDDWLTDNVTDWPTGRMITVWQRGWLLELGTHQRVIVQLTDWWLSDNWVTDCQQTSWVTDWLTHWVTHLVTDQLNDWLTCRLTDRWTDWQTNWMSDYQINHPINLMTDRKMSEIIDYSQQGLISDTLWQRNLWNVFSHYCLNKLRNILRQVFS